MIAPLGERDPAVTTFESHLHAAVLESAPAAVALLRGPAFVLERVNPAFQRLAPGRLAPGRALAEAWPEAWAALAPALRHVLETGERVEREDHALELEPGPGRPIARVAVSFACERIQGPEGLPDRVLFTAVDRTGALRERERARLLSEMARELSRGAPLEAVVRPALEAGVRLLGGAAGALLRHDPEARTLRAAEDLASQDGPAPVLPLDRVAHARRAVEGLRAQFWTFAMAGGDEIAWAARLGAAACLEVPLVADGRCLGLFHVSYATERPPPRADELAFAADLAGHCAAALERARLAEARDEARRLYERVLSAVPAGICVLDGDTLRVRLANPAYLRFLDEPWSSRGVEGRALAEFVPRADEAGLTALFRRVALTGVPHVDEEYRHEGFERGVTFWRWSLLPLDRAGGKRDLAILALEITEQVRARRAAEAEAAESARELLRVQAIVEAMAEGVIIADRFGNVVLANEAAARLHRFASPAEYQRHLRDFPALFEVSLPGRPGALAIDEWPLGRLMRGLGPFDGYEVELARRDTGERFVFSYGGTVVHDARGEPDLYVLTVRDLTAERQASAEKARLLDEVRRQSASLDGVISSMADGLLLFDAAGRLVRFNEAARLISGYGFEHLGITYAERARELDMQTADGRPLAAGDLPVARALRGETTRGMVVAIQGRSGRRVSLALSSAPLRAPDGALLGAVATFTDVTALRDLQDQQEDLVRTLSHDVRTPLAVIVNQAELLQRSLVGGTAERRLGSIAASAKRITAMINDLVEIAKMRGGHLAVEPEEVDFGAFARELLERHQGPLPTERVRLDVPRALPPVRADPLRLERILVNLVSNALKYSTGEVRLCARADRRQLVVDVADQGRGIASEDLPRIFERFYRAPASGRIEGLGLGLYVARTLAEAHGGSLEAVSEGPGRGATFTLALPIA